MSSILKSTSNVVESLAAAEVRKRQKRGDKEEKGREERERKAIGDNTLGRQFAGKKKKQTTADDDDTSSFSNGTSTVFFFSFSAPHTFLSLTPPSRILSSQFQ